MIIRHLSWDSGSQKSKKQGMQTQSVDVFGTPVIKTWRVGGKKAKAEKISNWLLTVDLGTMEAGDTTGVLAKKAANPEMYIVMARTSFNHLKKKERETEIFSLINNNGSINVPVKKIF